MNVSKIRTTKNQKTKTNIGTPLYMSPEVATSQLYDEKCDIWSLGVVIFQLCCLKNPFTMTSLTELGSSTQSYATLSKKDEARANYPFHKIPLRYSNTLGKLIRRMLQHRPEDRIPIPEILQICRKQGVTNNEPRVNIRNSVKAKENSNSKSSHMTVFKTIVFPQTSQRWVNLVKGEESPCERHLDLTIDEILMNDDSSEASVIDTPKCQRQHKENLEPLNQYSDYYGLESSAEMLQSKEAILKKRKPSIQMAVKLNKIQVQLEKDQKRQPNVEPKINNYFVSQQQQHEQEYKLRNLRAKNFEGINSHRSDYHESRPNRLLTPRNDYDNQSNGSSTSRFNKKFQRSNSKNRQSPQPQFHSSAAKSRASSRSRGKDCFGVRFIKMTNKNFGRDFPMNS